MTTVDIANRERLLLAAMSASEHTMGSRLADYVLPKVPLRELAATGGRVRVYANQSLSLATGGVKRQGKRFNWRRPFFTTRNGTLHCVVTPGRDYTYHYARLLTSACALADLEPNVTVENPHPGQAAAFVDRWLPTILPQAEVVILGYVERLFQHLPGSWVSGTGFGWRTARVGRTLVLLLGCEFSYWGDLAGALVQTLAARQRARYVIYVGKLGALQPGPAPNRCVATGSSSSVAGELVQWQSQLELADAPAAVLTGQRHVTMPSTLDETQSWYADAIRRFDLVDPEIGRMAAAARQAGVGFDYLHIITDNLSGKYLHGLYDERSATIVTRRTECLKLVEEILYRSIR